MSSAVASIESAAPVVSVPAGKRSKRGILLGGVVGAAVVVAAYFYTQRGIESTDDAQIDAELIAVPARVSGTISRVLFSENQRVERGAVLAEIEDLQAKAKLAQAEANWSAAVAAAEAADVDVSLAETNAVGNKSVAAASLQTAAVGAASSKGSIQEGEASVRVASSTLAQAAADQQRAQTLFKNGSIPQMQFDAAETAFQVAVSNLDAARARLSGLKLAAAQAQSKVAEASAKARQVSDVETLVQLAQARAKAAHAGVEQMRAARDLAALDLSYTHVLAPHDGIASKKSIAVGQSVAAGQTIVQLVTSPRWVTANFKETQLTAMHAGQSAEIRVDAFPQLKLHGKVESFSGATGARFTLLPPDNASGNFTKVVQRVPVRIQLEDAQNTGQLWPGLSVDVEVNTR